MSVQLKPLAEQTIVITGATSGHGLATAKKAAAAGAKVMLAARDERALIDACADIRASGGVAEYVVTDVSVEADVDHLATETLARLGGFDTWVNNAGSGTYAPLDQLPIRDHRQVFETNYWGVVHGSLAALRHLKAAGGALINVGSINGDMASPILGAYNASKHAVKGFTDSLRLDLMAEKAPVSVTLIKPAAIGTPFPRHGRNLTGYEARLPRPMYAPDLVADAILDAAQHPRRDITVGGLGKLQVLSATLMPSFFDLLASKMDPALIDKTKPVGKVEGNLYAPQHDDGDVEGEQHGRTFSTFTAARTHPLTAFGMVAATIAGLALAARRPSSIVRP